MARDQARRDPEAAGHATYPTYSKVGERRPNRPKIGHARRRRINERDGYKCRNCGLNFTGCVNPAWPHHAPYRDGVTLQVDHITPVSAGRFAFHDEANLQSLCQRCNGSKGARH